MDKLVPSPCKRIRISNDYVKPIQCIREFKLVQQYPSEKILLKGQNIQTSKVENRTITTLKIVPKANKNNISNTHKLRLKLPNGKDLGEFNVRVLTEEDLNDVQSLLNYHSYFKDTKKMGHFMDTTSHEKSTVDSIESSSLRVQRNAVVLPKSLYLNKISSKNQVSKTNINSNEEESRTLLLSDVSVNSQKRLRQQEYNTIKDIKGSGALSAQQNSSGNLLKSKVEDSQWRTNIVHKKMRDNVMVVVPDNIMSLLYEKNENKEKNNNVNDKQINIPVVEKISKNSSSKENYPHKSLNSEQWSQVVNVLGQALNSVQDEELRDKALKALMDCGIGVERKVPAPPRTATNNIRDSKVQTEVYSLLEPGSFIIVKEDVPGVERVQTNEKSNTLDVVNRSTNEIKDTIPNYLSYNTLDEEKAAFGMSLDFVINRICEENSGASQVKEAMSQTNPLFNKISSQLQKDFEKAKEWDESGMLAIHRAVIYEQTNDIRRHLFILKACKENVDIPTLSGMTSLDLAIKHNVSSDIVKLLLQAGADPVSPRSTDDCALLTASRLCSGLLPELVKHVKQSKSLNRVDSIGFAPLHYCALYGNLSGVTALISAGADVNLKDNRSGRTAIFIAIENEQYAVAQALHDYGASLDISNFAGQTVRSLTDDVKNASIRALLHKAMR